MKKIQIKCLIVAAVLAVFLFPPKISAHPGNTASDGCHYCRTNCSSWGEVYGARHCHGGGYTTPTIPSIPTTPTCPLHSRYNSLRGQCECNYGYVSSGNSCISQDQYCRDKYGLFAQYDILYDSCGCMSGYLLINGQCKNDDSYCRGKLGFNSRYNSLNDSCECSYGYVINSSRTNCISKDEVCREQFGIMAKSNYSGNCECTYGYHFEGNQCVIDDIDLRYGGITYEEDTTSFLIEELPDEPSVPTPTFTPTSKSNPTPKLSPTLPPSSTPKSSPSPKPSPSPKVLGEDTETSSGDVIAGLTVFSGFGYIMWRAIKQKWPFHAE